jgi:hypothetical protein
MDSMSLPSLEMSDETALALVLQRSIDRDQISTPGMKMAELLAKIAQDQCLLFDPVAFASPAP